MKNGTRLILIASTVLALGVALVPPVVSYAYCQGNLREFSEDQQEWAAILAKKKTLQQVSDRALLRALHDEEFSAGRWHPPTCRLADDLTNFGLAGLAAFLVAFIGAHLVWLAARAFNKLMDKLQ